MFSTDPVSAYAARNMGAAGEARKNLQETESQRVPVMGRESACLEVISVDAAGKR